MKQSDLRKLIKEEISKVKNELKISKEDKEIANFFIQNKDNIYKTFVTAEDDEENIEDNYLYILGKSSSEAKSILKDLIKRNNTWTFETHSFSLEKSMDDFVGNIDKEMLNLLQKKNIVLYEQGT
mgnify:CR=1 FL=1